MAKNHKQKGMDHVMHHSKGALPGHETPFVKGGGGMPGNAESVGHVHSHKPHHEHVRSYLHGK